MFGKEERAARLAYRAWAVGDLVKASSLLESLPRPLSAGAAFTSARVSSEQGDCSKALQTLDEATSNGADRRVATLHRGVILYDHDRAGEAVRELSGLSSENPIAAGLLALESLARVSAATADLAVPRTARWMAEISGRLLAILEERLLRAGAVELTKFHHGLFLPAAPTPRDPIELAFAEQRFDDVVRLCEAEGEGASKYCDYQTFSLMALERDKQSGDVLSQAIRECPASADFHFLAGLRHSRAGRRREAGWSFVRAARMADVDVDDVLTGLAARVGVKIRLDD